MATASVSGIASWAAKPRPRFWIAVILVIICFACLYPILFVVGLSFSSRTAAATGAVKLWPVDFTLSSYQYVFKNPAFIQSVGVSFERVLIGVPVNMILTVLVAYPLSMKAEMFRWRTVYAWFFVITIFVSGGLIPLYLVVREVGLIDNIFALILPTAVPVFNVILLLNFFRGLPGELLESAMIDGASHWTILWRIYIPLSAPAIATVALLSFVFHWNSWFDGIIFMNNPAHYPLQTYLESLLVNGNLTGTIDVQEQQLLLKVSNQTFQAAEVCLAAIPVVLIYPFVQRFFTRGLVLGSVKG